MDITTALIGIGIGIVIGGIGVWAALRSAVDRKARALVYSYAENLEAARQAEATVTPIRKTPADDIA